MKISFSFLVIIVFGTQGSFAQEDCYFYPKDTIECFSMKEDVRKGSKSNVVDTLESIPSVVQKSADKFINTLDSGVQRQIVLAEVRLNKSRTDYQYLANTYLYLYSYKSTPMVKIFFAIAIDSLGTKIKTYGIPDSAWYSIEKPFLSFCKASSMFGSSYPTTKLTKYRELEVVFKPSERSYFWKMRKIKSSIVNKLGDRKGIDCKLTIDAITHSITYESKNKVAIKHSSK